MTTPTDFGWAKQMGSVEPLRLGIVGCGGISHAHAKAAQSVPGIARFVSCCDVREDVAQAWASQYGCESFHTDLAHMLQRERLDGVLLATWPTQHREQIQLCLEAGLRNILCEKALTLTGQDALDILHIVRDHDAFLMEGFMYRHHPAIARMRELLDSGHLGTIDSIRADFSAFDAETPTAEDPARNWRQRKECGGGVPYDFACYCVNACNYFAGGLPTRVYCCGGRSERYGTINRLHAIVEYDNSVVGIVESSKRADMSQRLEIVCAQGRLVLPVSWRPYDDVSIVEQRSSSWAKYDQTDHPVPTCDPYQRQLENFAAVIRDGASPVIPLLESVINIHTIEALTQSLEQGRPIGITLPPALLTKIREESL